MKRRKGQRCDRFLATPSMPSMFVFFQCSCVHVPQCPTLCSLYDNQNSEDKIFKGIQMSWQNKYPARCRSWWMFDDFCLTLLPGLENSRQHWGVWCDHSGSPAATTLAFLEPGKNSFNRTTLDTFHGYHLLSSSSSAHFLSAHWTQWLHTCQSLFEELLQLCQRLLSVQFLARGPFLHAKMIKGVWYLHMFARSFVTTLWVSGPMLPVKPCEVS